MELVVCDGDHWKVVRNGVGDLLERAFVLLFDSRERYLFFGEWPRKVRKARMASMVLVLHFVVSSGGILARILRFGNCWVGAS